MKLNKMAATAVMAGALGSAALGIGAGLAQADPNGPGPGPNVPGPNVPGPGVPGPDQDRPGPGQYVPGQPICNPGAPGVNCTNPGTPLPPGRDAPPPNRYNDPIGYGLPPMWMYNGQNLPVVYDPMHQAWGVNASDGFHAYTGPEGTVGGQAGGQAGVQPGR